MAWGESFRADYFNSGGQRYDALHGQQAMVPSDIGMRAARTRLGNKPGGPARRTA